MKSPIFSALLAAALLPALSSAQALGEAGDKPQFRLCYFSLNNGDEVSTVQNFMNKLNPQAPFEVLVEEHQPLGADPNKAFKAMVDQMVADHKQCNAIVFSGHHTGNFGGARAKRGKLLSLDALEDLSCNPKYNDFFRGVNAYWGEGCRTMGAEVTPDDSNELDANWQANRVNNDAQGDQLYQGMAALENEFTNTLDQDNPLSSRYMRLFPNAKLFGWTKRSPGDKAGSKFSLTYHIAHMARLLDAEDKFPDQGPNTDAEFSANNAAKYAEAVMALLASSNDESEKACDALATQAWHNHGDVGVSRRFTYDNPFANGFLPLSKSQDAAMLLNAKEIDCRLKAAVRSGSTAKLNEVLDRLIEQPDALRYSFNTLVDLRNELRRKASKETASQDPNIQARGAQDKAMAAIVLEKMRQHPKIQELLQGKLNASTVGVLRKVDYYEFYRQLTGDRMPDLETAVQTKAEKELTKPLPAGSGDHYARWEQVDYRKILLQSLLKNKMADSAFFSHMLDETEHPNLDREVLVLLRQNVGYAPAGQRESLVSELDQRIASTPAWTDSADDGGAPAGAARSAFPQGGQPQTPGTTGFPPLDFIQGLFK